MSPLCEGGMQFPLHVCHLMPPHLDLSLARDCLQTHPPLHPSSPGKLLAFIVANSDPVAAAGAAAVGAAARIWPPALGQCSAPRLLCRRRRGRRERVGIGAREVARSDGGQGIARILVDDLPCPRLDVEDHVAVLLAAWSHIDRRARIWLYAANAEACLLHTLRRLLLVPRLVPRHLTARLLILGAPLEDATEHVTALLLRLCISILFLVSADSIIELFKIDTKTYWGC